MSMDIGGIIDSGTSIAGLISGAIIQDETQAELKKAQAERPEYYVPNSIQAQVDLLRKRAEQGFSGQDMMQGQIKQNTAQGLAASGQAATSAADLQGMTTQLYSNQTRALTDLQIQSGMQRSQNELAYAQGLGTMGEYQDKEWSWNKATDWQTNMNRLNGISQAAYDLQMGGLGGVSSAFDGMTVGGGNTGGGTSNDYSGYSNPQGYGVQGVDPAMNNLNLQTSSYFQ